MMEIIKRSGQAEAYDRSKIANAIRKAFISTQTQIDQPALDAITEAVEDVDGMAIHLIPKRV